MMISKDEIDAELDKTIECLRRAKRRIRNRDVATIGPLLPSKGKLHELKILVGDLEIRCKNNEDRKRKF